MPALSFEPPIAMAIDDVHYVFKNRQKYIELRCFSDYQGTVRDPDDLPAYVVDEPFLGDLYSMGGATYLYVPNANSTGVDSLEFECGTSLNTATVTIYVVEPEFDPDGVPEYLEDQFVMPHGLGPPSFGMLEEAGEWTYYVDVGEGVDGGSNPHWPYGSDTHPRLTIPLCLEAGDVVEVHGYGPSAGPLEIEAPGTEEDPIFIRGAGPLDRATLQQGLKIQGDYVIVEYIDFDASSEPATPPTFTWFHVTDKYLGSNTWTGYDHVAIRHCGFASHPTEIFGDAIIAMLFEASHCCEDSPPNNTTLIQNCVVYDTLVTNFGNWEETEGGHDYGACLFGPNSKNMWCLDSVFHHIESTGVGLTRHNALSEQLCSRNCYVGRNVIHHMKEYGVSGKMTKDSIISDNKVYRIRGSFESSSLGAAIFVGNNDTCNSNGNTSDDRYSDNVWVLFNECYDVQTGARLVEQVHCDGSVCCCAGSGPSCCSTEAPNYEDSRAYVVGNVFHHIEPFGKSQATSFGQAVLVGQQVQARVVNNTIYECAQGVQIGCTYGEGIGGCPPDGDDNNESRNTSAAVWNNVFLDTPDDSTNDSHVRVCTGPPFYDFTLTDTEFDRNLHYGDYRDFRIPSGPWFSVEELQDDGDTEYGAHSKGDLEEDNPDLENPALLRFDLSGDSPDFMSTNGVRDEAYCDFEAAFSTFPPIFHDYAGEAYSGNTCGTSTCAIGAFKREWP